MARLTLYSPYLNKLSPLSGTTDLGMSFVADVEIRALLLMRKRLIREYRSYRQFNDDIKYFGVLLPTSELNKLGELPDGWVSYDAPAQKQDDKRGLAPLSILSPDIDTMLIRFATNNVDVSSDLDAQEYIDQLSDKTLREIKKSFSKKYEWVIFNNELEILCDINNPRDADIVYRIGVPKRKKSTMRDTIDVFDKKEVIYAWDSSRPWLGATNVLLPPKFTKFRHNNVDTTHQPMAWFCKNMAGESGLSVPTKSDILWGDVYGHRRKSFSRAMKIPHNFVTVHKEICSDTSTEEAKGRETQLSLLGVSRRAIRVPGPEKAKFDRRLFCLPDNSSNVIYLLHDPYTNTYTDHGVGDFNTWSGLSKGAMIVSFSGEVWRLLFILPHSFTSDLHRKSDVAVIVGTLVTNKECVKETSLHPMLCLSESAARAFTETPFMASAVSHCLNRMLYIKTTIDWRDRPIWSYSDKPVPVRCVDNDNNIVVPVFRTDAVMTSYDYSMSRKIMRKNGVCPSGECAALHLVSSTIIDIVTRFPRNELQEKSDVSMQPVAVTDIPRRAVSWG